MHAVRIIQELEESGDNLSVVATDLRAIERASSFTRGAALTRRETEILYLASQGMTMRLIAGELDIVEATVKFHLRSVRGKLDARNTPQAIARFAALNVPTIPNGNRSDAAIDLPTGRTC